MWKRHSLTEERSHTGATEEKQSWEANTEPLCSGKAKNHACELQLIHSTDHNPNNQLPYVSYQRISLFLPQRIKYGSSFTGPPLTLWFIALFLMCKYRSIKSEQSPIWKVNFQIFHAVDYTLSPAGDQVFLCSKLVIRTLKLTFEATTDQAAVMG